MLVTGNIINLFFYRVGLVLAVEKSMSVRFIISWVLKNEYAHETVLPGVLITVQVEIFYV